MSESQPRLYRELAQWWPLLSAPEDYEEEAGWYARALIDGCDRRPHTVLELGSGGGNNASHLKRSFTLTLVDRSEGMVAVSRALNPDCEHVVGDMRTVRLDRQFDAVFIHDAIGYMTTERDLAAAIETAHVHCRVGGVALLVPDCVRESFAPCTTHGGHDRGARGLRYLEWSWDPDPDDTTYLADYAYLLRDETGQVTVAHDRHVMGLFARDTWLRLIEEAGFQASVADMDIDHPYDHTYQAFIARRPAPP